LDKLISEKAEIKTDLSKQTDLVSKLKLEGEEMKIALNKLTDVRTMLNKHFSVNSGNFT
jgi:hypothetical protein